MDDATKMCPNCEDVELEVFEIGGKDNVASNGDVEIYVGRIYALACPHCQYVDEPYFA